MATGTTVLEAALRDIGVLGSAGTASTDQKSDGLVKINYILGSWSFEGMLQPYQVSESFSVANALASRTIGSGADLNTVRPVEIEAMWFRDSDNVDHPVELITAEKFAKLPAKGLMTDRPTQIYYEPVDSADITRGVLNFNSTTIATETLHIISKKEFSELSAITDTILLPTPWIRALGYVLAMDSALQYGIAIKPELAALAAMSINRIRGYRGMDENEQPLQVARNEN